MAAQLDFAVGAAVILAPHYGIPVFIGSSVGKLLLKNKRRRQKQTEATVSTTDKQQVKLQWSHVSCQLMTKKGETKQLLKDQSGVAEPNRYMLAVLFLHAMHQHALVTILSV